MLTKRKCKFILAHFLNSLRSSLIEFCQDLKRQQKQGMFSVLAIYVRLRNLIEEMCPDYAGLKTLYYEDLLKSLKKFFFLPFESILLGKNSIKTLKKS
jgi:hypothetical protein